MPLPQRRVRVKQVERRVKRRPVRPCKDEDRQSRERVLRISLRKARSRKRAVVAAHGAIAVSQPVAAHGAAAVQGPRQNSARRLHKRRGPDQAARAFKP